MDANLLKRTLSKIAAGLILLLLVSQAGATKKEGGTYEISGDVVTSGITSMQGTGDITLDSYVGQTGGTYLWGGDVELFAGFLSMLGTPPFFDINFSSQALDGSGEVEISVSCSDPEKEVTRMQVLWSSDGGSTYTNQASLVPGYITSDIQTPLPSITTDLYQIGNSTRIITTSTNTITFKWDSKTDRPNIDGTEYLKLFLTDDNMDFSRYYSFTLDNKAPITSMLKETAFITSDSITLNYGAPATETNFSEYVIFYATYTPFNAYGINVASFTKNEASSLGVINYGGASSVTVTGLSNNTGYYFNLFAYDTYGNLGSTTTVGPIATTSLPSIYITDLQVARDGTGYVRLVADLFDVDHDSCSIKMEYNVDGSGWNSATILVATDNAGAILPFDNNEEYQIGPSTDVATPNTLTIVWDTKADGIGESSNVKIQLTPHSSAAFEGDGLIDESSVFTVDNTAPQGLAGLQAEALYLTASSIRYNWTPATDPNFDTYEIWYATFSPITRNGAAQALWNDTDDSVLAVAATSSTIVTSLLEGATYYANIWATDNYGNVSTSISEVMARTEWRPVAQNFVTVPAQSVAGDGKVPMSVRVYDNDLDSTLRMGVFYSTSGVSGPWQKANIETGSISVTQGSVPGLNNSAVDYQIGTAGNYIDVSAGLNDVGFTWDSKQNIPNMGVTAYIRITLTDGTNVDLSPLDSIAFAVDNVVPSYAYSRYIHTSKELDVRFSESIFTSNKAQTGITLSNDLSGADYGEFVVDETPLTLGTTLYYTLTDSHRDTISEWQRKSANLRISLEADVAKDTNGNYNTIVATTNVTGWTKDPTITSLTNAGYSFFTRDLDLIFNNPVNKTSLTQSNLAYLILQDKANISNTSNYLKVSTTSVIDVYYSSATITLGEADWKQIASWDYETGASTKTLYVAVTTGTFIQSLAGSYLPIISSGSATQLITYDQDTTAPVINEIYPVENAIDLDPVNLKIQLKFNELMYTPTLSSAFSVRAVRDNLSNDLNQVISGTVNFNADTFELAFTPSTALKYNYKYEVNLALTAQDISRNEIASAKIWEFTNLMNYQEDNVVVSIKPEGRTRIDIPEGFLIENGYLIVNNDPLNTQNEVKLFDITEANRKKQNESAFNNPILASIHELIIKDQSGVNMAQRLAARASSPENSGTSDPAKFATITIPYADADGDGIVDGSNPPVRVKTLRMYWLDEEHKLWVRVPDAAIDTVNKTLSAKVPHFSVFGLIGAEDNDLSNAYAFPVPYKPSDPQHKNITFTNLASECEVKIFTISGELVRTFNHLDTSGSAVAQEVWNVKTDSGDNVFSGVYIYYIKSKTDKKTGKLMIIR
ncbi:MAG: Ig-like domain-containing protein [Elusimicrobiota bacterium]